MPSIVTSRLVQPAPRIGEPVAAPARRLSAVSIAVAGAWLISIVALATGNAALLHHHSLIEGGPPLWVGVPLFLLGWQVMVAAMMLPASLPTIYVARSAMRHLPRPGLAQAAFLSAFALVWTIFGLLAFTGDLALHHLVDATPWLAARPWLIEASVLALAGAYQFAPLKRRSLAACRHPEGLLPAGSSPEHGWLRPGLDHGLACLGSSWALMLLMFAEGFANLGWMAALTALMVYEATGPRGERAARASGVVLFLAALTVLSGPLPGTV